MSRPICLPFRGLIPSVLLLLVCGAASAAEPEGANLVRQLGDDSYQVRQQAAKQLADLELKAQDALQAGLKDSDPQIRRQCRWILSDVMEGEFQQRVQAFLADTEDKQQHRIPGWERYRETVGKDADARKLFVEMLKAERGLLESTAAGPAAAGEGLTLRLRQLMQAMQSPDPKIRKIPSLGTTATLLFVLCDPQVELQNPNEDSYLQNFIQQGEFQKALTEGPFKPGVRKLVGQWMLRPGSDNNLYMKFHLTMQYDIKEGLETAIRILRDRQPNRTHFRIQAMGIVAKLGGKEYAGLLDSLLDDKTEAFRGQIAPNKQVNVQVRDVALAWLIHITDQDHAQYGMNEAKKDFEQVKKNPKHYQPNFVQLGFPDDAKRDEALKKWKAYVADHPLPKLPTLPPPADPPKPVVARVVPRVGRVVRVAGNQPGKEQRDTEGVFRGITLEMADRVLVQALNNARLMCQRGEYAAAMPLLDKILALPSDYAFQPDVEVPLLRCLKPEAEGILAALPPKGLAAYKSLYEANARHDLAEATKAGDIKAVAAVGQRFFFTNTGAEATYLLAAHYRDRGQFFHAALYFERVRNRSPYADRLEPALSLGLATSLSRAGMSRAADGVLRTLQARDPAARMPIAGVSRALFVKADEALRWLETIAGPLKAVAAEGWLMFRGDPTRNVATAVGNPFLRAKSLLPMSADSEVAQTVAELRTKQWEQYRAALPTLHPLVVGDTVLLRTDSQLAAVKLPDGGLLWQAGLEDSLCHRLQIKAKAPSPLKSESFSQSLRRRFWQDMTFGTLSSDGQRVFGVEDVIFGSWTEEQRMVVGPDGQRRLDNDALKKHNLLTAHDIVSGKLVWEIGGLPGSDTGPLAGAMFLGPPLPLGGRLYVVADLSNETRLLEIDAKTGSLLNELTLALREKSPEDGNGMVFFAGVQPSNGNLNQTASSSPSYAEGVLVCRAAENQYIAVSLATRSVLWVYQMPEPEGSGVGMFGILRQRQMLEALDPTPRERWADGSVTIAAGRVLLTPPDADELHCLDLRDGRLLWSAPRRDGLYVGGVAEGRVLLVGRGGLWALNLDDGTPAWTPQRLVLPAGALPSGRGLLSQGRYLLPLSTGEVAAVDLKKGRLMSRSRSPEHIVPGNLIAYRDAVLAQGVDGLWRFDSLATRDGQLTAALRERPDDPELLAERGAVLLGDGQIAEAVALLRKALEKKPSPEARQWLADALLDGLRADFETFSPQAEELDTLIAESAGRQHYLRELAAGLQQTKRPQAAFAAYLKLIDVTEKPEELERVETARVVRRDRWLAARIEEVRAAAAPAERAEIDRQIASRLRDDKLREFVAYFGSHPAAHKARLQLAQQAVEKQEWAAAEQWLRAVARGGDAAQQNAAVARLAALLRETKQTEDAARCYDILRGRLAQVSCLDGKTGSQLFAALPADDPVRRTLESPAKWPKGKVRVEAPDKPNNNNGSSQRVSLITYWEEDPFTSASAVEVDMNQRRIAASDNLGRKRWEVSMADKDQQWQFVQYPDAGSQLWPLGHLNVAWVGNRVAAIDTLGEKAKVLWTQEPIKMHPQFGWIGFPGRMRARMMMGQQGQPTVLPASEPLPLVATPQGVCFLENRTLRAFDPLSGKELWNRDDVTADSSLFGDDELLLVTPPDTNEAVVFSVLDGREVGRCSVPPLAERLWTSGRRVVTWKATQGKVRMTLVDPWTGQTIWQRDFDPKAQPWLIDGNEVAVLEPEGLFSVIALMSGEPVMQAQVDAMPKLEGIFVLRSAGQYTLIARDPSVGKNPQTMLQQQFMGSYPVTGRVYGLDRRTGKLAWSAVVDKQGIRMGQPAELPVLTFFIQGNVLEGNQYRGHAALLCLDRRDGRVLHSKESKNQHPQFFETQVDLEKSLIELRTPLGPVKMTFTDEPAAGK